MCQSRNWVFTDFEIIEWNNIWEENKDIIRYMCWGEEVCPKTQRKHLQGWIQFYNKKRMKGLKNIARSKKLHVEVMIANEVKNNKYCMKDGKYETRGKYVSQGERSDLERCKQLIDQGVKEIDLANGHFQIWCMYRTSFDKYRQLKIESETREFRHVDVQVYSGETGTHKTRKAMESPDVFKINGDELQWWDGYNGQKTLVIDEYANQISCTKLLGILDGYQLRLAVKGGFTYANWNKIILTTNLDILHENAKYAHRLALDRRINKYWEFNEEHEMTEKCAEVV